MARPRLTSAKKTAAKNVAQKIAGKAKTTATAVSGKATTIAKSVVDKIPTSITTSPNSTANNTGFSTTVPGLVGITPDVIAGMMPQFQESAYVISDPLNPPETLPQVTRSPV
jgi:hypothetical protein